jgi:hypothetical protein
MRYGLVAAMSCVPAAAYAQAWGAGGAREVLLTSRAAPGSADGARVAVSLSLGPGFSRTGFSGGAHDISLSGASAFASLRLSVRVASRLALQVGAAGGLALSPSVVASSPPQRVELEGVSGFGLAGAGLVVGGHRPGPRASLLGGVAWAWAPLDGSLGARSGARAGGGAVLELGYHWAAGDRWCVGLGASAWGLFGADAAPWLDASAAPVSWSALGGALVATVSTR